MFLHPYGLYIPIENNLFDYSHFLYILYNGKNSFFNLKKTKNFLFFILQFFYGFLIIKLLELRTHFFFTLKLLASYKIFQLKPSLPPMIPCYPKPHQFVEKWNQLKSSLVILRQLKHNHPQTSFLL